MTWYPTQSHYPNQSLPYPIDVEHQAMKQQVSILEVIGLTRPGAKLPISHMWSLRSTGSATVPGPMLAMTVKDYGESYVMVRTFPDQKNEDIQPE